MKMSSCAKCDLLCLKPSQNWWPPGQIKFCWAQVMFLLANIELLKAGKWPAKTSGYIDTHEDVQISKFKQGNTAILDVLAELDKRIDKLPKSHQNIISNTDWYCDYYSLSPEARNIVNYLSGKYKVQTFSQWKAGRNRDLKRV